jgi:hypothetical protein
MKFNKVLCNNGEDNGLTRGEVRTSFAENLLQKTSFNNKNMRIRVLSNDRMDFFENQILLIGVCTGSLVYLDRMSS